MTTKAIGLGAGGHAKVMIDALLLCPGIEVVGLLDADPTSHGTRVLGVEVLGGDDLLARFASDGFHFFIGVGGAAGTTLRRSLYEKAIGLGMEPLGFVHPAATIAESAELGGGVDVLAGVVVGADAVLKENVLVNTHAVVEHDAVVGDHVHVAVSAAVLGGATIGAGAFIGSGAVIREGIRIGEAAVVAAGAVAARDVPDGVVVMGIPAKITGKASS